MIWPDFGIGKIGTAAVIAVAIGGAVYLAYNHWEDVIGDRREAQIERDALEKRLENVTDSKERQILLERLPRFAKMWCAIDLPDRTCCARDAVRLPKCTADPAGKTPRPD